MIFDFYKSRKELIVILLGAPFTLQNFRRAGIPFLLEYFDVIVLDCNRWIRVGYDKLKFTEYYYPKVIKISSKLEFEKAINEIRPNYAIDFIGLNIHTRFIQIKLQENGTKYVILKWVIPYSHKRTKLIFKNPRFFFLRIIRKLASFNKKNRPLAPDIALLAGKQSLDAWTLKAKEILWIPSEDYYTYRNVKDKFQNTAIQLPFKEKYVLFIDDCLALANDYKLLGLSPPIEASSYHRLLKQAFDIIESLVGLQVIVAAHPNGKDIPNYNHLFGDRNVYFDITAELCAKSELVISHFSTALGYAVLWNKPIILFTSKLLKRSTIGLTIEEMSIQLQCPLLFMESSRDFYSTAYNMSKNVDSIIYQNYIQNYIKTNEVIEDAPWQTFINYAKHQSKVVSNSQF